MSFYQHLARLSHKGWGSSSPEREPIRVVRPHAGRDERAEKRSLRIRLRHRRRGRPEGRGASRRAQPIHGQASRRTLLSYLPPCRPQPCEKIGLTPVSKISELGLAEQRSHAPAVCKYFGFGHALPTRPSSGAPAIRLLEVAQLCQKQTDRAPDEIERRLAELPGTLILSASRGMG